MTVNAARFVSLFPSERLLAGFDGQPPFKACGIATDIIVTGYGTLGGSQTKGNGRPFTNDDFTNQLKIGWRAFERVHDSNGIPDRDDMARIHGAMFPGLPDPQPLVSGDFDEVVEALKADYAISMAGRLSVVAGQTLARFTQADHQFPMVGIANGRTTVQDPMHPPALRWGGHKVPLTQIEKAAKAIGGGTVLAWKVPVGGWTQAALQTEALRDRLRESRERGDFLFTQVENKEAKVVELRARVAQLQAANTNCAPLVDNARNAGWTAALEAMKRDADRHIGEGPP